MLKVIRRVKLILLILFPINPLLVLILWEMIADPSVSRYKRYLDFLYYADQEITAPKYAVWHGELDTLVASSPYIIFTYATLVVLMIILTGEYLKLPLDKEYREG